MKFAVLEIDPNGALVGAIERYIGMTYPVILTVFLVVSVVLYFSGNKRLSKAVCKIGVEGNLIFCSTVLGLSVYGAYVFPSELFKYPAGKCVFGIMYSLSGTIMYNHIEAAVFYVWMMVNKERIVAATSKMLIVSSIANVAFKITRYLKNAEYNDEIIQKMISLENINVKMSSLVWMFAIVVSLYFMLREIVRLESSTGYKRALIVQNVSTQVESESLKIMPSKESMNDRRVSEKKSVLKKETPNKNIMEVLPEKHESTQTEHEVTNMQKSSAMRLSFEESVGNQNVEKMPETAHENMDNQNVKEMPETAHEKQDE